MSHPLTDILNGKAPVVAYQPDLFGAPEEPGHAYRPAFYAVTWAGMVLPISGAAQRQVVLMHADSHPALAREFPKVAR